MSPMAGSFPAGDAHNVPSVDPANQLLQPVPWVPFFGKAEINGQTFWTMTIRTPDTTFTVMAPKEDADKFADMAKQSVALASPLLIPDNAASLFKKGGQNGVHGQ